MSFSYKFDLTGPEAEFPSPSTRTPLHCRMSPESGEVELAVLQCCSVAVPDGWMEGVSWAEPPLSSFLCQMAFITAPPHH